MSLHGDNLAYVIYTSGSTGKPKGVTVRHQALSHFLISMRQLPGIDADDTLVSVTALSFDIAALELYVPLIAGARVVLTPQTATRDGLILAQLLATHQPNLLQSTPAGWRMLLAAGWKGPQGEGKKSFKALCGGETLQIDLANQLRELGVELWNMYGPTETTIWSVAGSVDKDTDTPSLGTPVAGTNAYILDAYLNPVPQGVAGELYLGGIGLARGYLNRGGLSAERFIADPFDDQGGRLYRTGDVARWRADGQIEYLGRLDHQVKVRGFRIELGEIEAQLLAQAGVREAVAIAREGASGTRLIAYVSLHAGAEVEAGALREGIAKVLPDYMLPSAIIVLEALPLNPNGKVDRKALPEPELAHRDNHEPPQGEVEEALAGIWAAVLGIGQVGRNDNFFEMGGDSILSLQIVTKARRAGWKITPRQLFERQNIAALAELVETIQESNAVASERGYLHDYVSAEVVASLVFTDDDIDDVYPLSPTQEGMLFHTLESAEEGTGLYVNQLSVEVEGLDPERLASAWQAMVRRHPVLRTGFLWQAGLARPLQIVFRQASVPIVPVVHLDWSGLDQLESRIAAYADEDLKREFDFLNPPLVRLSLIRIAENRHRLIWTRHHILLDGWSDTRLISEWLRSYDNEILEPRGPDYGNYVRWLARQNVEATRDFWQTELLGLEGPTLLAKPATKATAKEGRSGFAQIYTRLTPEETRQLQAFAQRQRVTVNTIVQAAWGLLLQRHTGRETVVFGATVAGRPPSLPNSEEILGLFINTIPVPIGRRSNLSVAEHLGLLQQTNARLREHEHASLADVQRWAGSPGQPLFDSIVVFENYPVDEALRGNEFYGLRFGEVEGKGLTGYAMDLQVVIGDTLEIEYAYGRKDFADEFVLELRDHMELVIREMMAHPQRAMGELGWMGWAGLDSVFSLGRNQHVDRSVGNVPRHAVHHAIEQNALSRPGAIALLMDEQELCYSELNLRANRLAHHLISLGARTEIRIGVAMERSLDVIVALLAVLKAGAAYVPLDPEYPVERLSFMMEDSALSILITQSKVLPKLGAIKAARTVVLDTVDLGDGPDSNPQVSINEHNLAYVIYTSGSTGIPKGVAVTHGPLAMHCRATAEIYGMSPRSCELLFMSFSFDGAHERWLTALTVGAGLAVRDQELWTAEQTYRALHDYGITNAAFPPAYLGQVAEWAAPRSDPPPVELYVFGGEAMPKASYDLVRRTLRPRILINGYGPTETVVTPLIWRTEASSSFDCAYAPIGRPVGERAAYVLDVDMQPVPKGVVGELYIGGYGLARGYLGRAGLTAERFVADPFDEKGGGRLYRTGDLVRWLDDGNIEYIGRNDHQVKIRGFRIELGEIEARIREVTGVAEAAVVVHAGAAGHQLTAYVVPAPGAQSPVLTARLKQELAGRLPEYMIPAHIIAVAALPRLTSGKLDRQALPEPGVTDAAASDTYCAPSTREARLLAGIWQEVLGVERVGETDNFFALGGDSLSSLKVMARMRNLSEAKFDLKLRDLMQRPTIAGLLGLDLQAQQRTQALLALNLAAGKGHAQPLFCIHAGLGTVFDYQPLARQLQAKRTVYGLPCRMLADHTYNDVSLDQMAKDYSGIIRSMQPEGTYHLLGWSLGGTLAAMIAARLEAEGQTVAFLGLIDSFIPGDEQSESDDWRCDFSDFVSLVVPGAKPGDVIQDDLPDGECATESEQPSEQAITGLLEDLISAEQIRVRTGEEGNTEAGGYADMGAEELARIFIVARQLKALSLQASALSPLQVQATCWWAATRPLSDRLALALQIEQETLQSIELDADHFAIVRTESLLLGVESTLAATSDCVTKAEEVD
ncbi:non-ribosomal peptide synthetase [Nitrosospira sp. Nl5]|uniref:non-ribosomal peptide synthetase n=1 Tax=Nitrosospira sp. Nl5 TaxID=200120 RepID=UPI00210E09D5|nr:non-ribosomal peptide synthetase [Nitrosospira sp. Nl5]